MRLALLLSYDGTDFCGWQKQLKHEHASPLPNIQESLEVALKDIFKQEVSVSGSGRTDAGVHALNQVCHFEIEEKPLPKDLCWALKAKLPSTIVAKRAWIVPDDFHATLSAKRKTYRYWIWNHSRGTALLNRYSWWLRLNLDVEQLNEMSSVLIGTHDFASFRSMGTPVKHTIRKIHSAEWRRRSSGLLEFRISGNGFMKQMVRNIVGSHIDICFKKRTNSEARMLMQSMLEAKDRTRSGRAAPPQGLFLERVYYPDSLLKKFKRI